MPYFVGVGLALSVGLFATFIGLDRDRAFYSTVTIVVALYYALFAVMGESANALARESVGILLFVSASAMGFKRNMWVVVGALFAHGMFDLVHDRLVTNPGVPSWWPGFCFAYDVIAAAYLAALLLWRSRIAATRARG